MDTSILSQIGALQRMPVSDLQAKWLRLYGEPTRSRNKQFLFRRLAWRIQELQHGGLTDGAKQRIDALASDTFERPRTPAHAGSTPDAEPAGRAPRPRRDPRLPSAGSVITKQYKGRELRVVVREDGLELDGTMYPSATALAKSVTRSKSINGNLFLGITKRKRT